MRYTFNFNSFLKQSNDDGSGIGVVRGTGRQCQQDILDHVKENGDLFWKERSIFAIINSLMKKGCIKEDGMVRAGKTYARTFAPAMSRAEFYAGMVTNALTKKELVEFRRAMRQLANEDTESPDEEA